MILSRTLRRFSDRSCALTASALRSAADAALRLANRLSPAAEPPRALTAEDAFAMAAVAMPLPAPPPTTGDQEIDVANLITYQTALAEHAHRAEMVRTLGALAARFAR